MTDDLALLPSAVRREPPLRTLRQALGYGWSVVIAALPDEGLPLFRELESSPDGVLQWVARENRKKHRLQRLLDTTP